MLRTIALVMALAGALLVGWLGTKTPDPDGGSSAPEAFSTARAMVDIRRIAKAPHPTGSAANAWVRDYLVARMGQLGLSPQVRTGMGLQARVHEGEAWVLGGRMDNIVGVLPGRDRTRPALALMAHYDSVPASPGAADDAAGVAAALEVVRAIKARGTPARDVIVLFTDGEESGLLGARAFFTQDPLRDRIGLIINLEARGGGGRANMFQTGPNNGALIRAFAGSAVSPVSNSLAVFLYESMPNDTDFTVSNEAGVRGLNFAFIGRQFDYHAASSTPEALDRGSVRHLGEQALAAAAAFAFAETLPGRAPDAVYSQTFGDHVLAYPAWGGWIVLALVLALLAAAAVRARRAQALSWPDIGRGVGAALFLLLAGALLLATARKLTGVGFGYMEQRALLAQWGLWETTLAALGAGLLVLVPTLLARGGTAAWLAGAVALVTLAAQVGGRDLVALGLGTGAAVAALAAFRRPAALPGAWLGVLATGLAAALALQIALPAVAFLVAWPLALAALGAAVSDLGARPEPSRTAALALLAAAGGGWLAVFFHGVAQGLDQPMILALILWLGAMLVWPLTGQARTPARFALAPAAGLLALGLVLLLAVRFVEPWSERHPRASSVFHVTDATSGKSQLVSGEKTLTPWTRAALTAEGGKVAKAELPPLLRRAGWAAAGKPVTAGPAPVTASQRPDGRIDIHVPAADAVFLQLRDRKGILGDFEIGGTTIKVSLPTSDIVTVATPSTVNVRLAGLQSPLTLALPPAGESPSNLEVRYAVINAGWPAAAKPLAPRPKDLMPFDLSDSAVVMGTFTQPR